ncbi:hypothetical protein CAPTEDRAFT_208229 [Capitella teleta]|uniref:Endonuclease/exonuclease/phosphatase domain-containing protein n=1 Tax=Capitella teleta TaxID=283909 RepID=R7VHU1_CAPTE|nr:hypothetical protein CAPTEDRAFT_208229 [Capitella teleta]|eukprot:ELU15255.1 hypothetical protein CAPTEDRAFT_208229 [Capitella teleta]
MGRRTAKGQINHSKRAAGRVQIGLRPGIEDGEIIASNEIFHEQTVSSRCSVTRTATACRLVVKGFGGIVVEVVVVEVVKVWMPVLAFPDGGEGALDEDRILSLAMTSPAHHWVPADTTFFFVNTEAKLVPGAGDFNIDISLYPDSRLAFEFLDLVYSESRIPLIHSTTRHDLNRQSVIDNILTNDNNGIHDTGVNRKDISDHFPIV